MLYDEIKNSIKEAKSQLHSENIKLGNMERDLVEFDYEITQINKRYDSRIEDEERRARMDEEGKFCADARAKVDYIQRSIQSADDKYIRERDKFTLAYYKKKYAEDVDFIDELKSLADDVYKSIEELNTKEFAQDLKDSLEGKCLDLDIKEYKNLLNKLKNLDRKKLKKKDSRNFGTIVEFCFSIFNPETDNKFFNTGSGKRSNKKSNDAKKDEVEDSGTGIKKEEKIKEDKDTNKEENSDKTESSKQLSKSNDNKPKVLDNIVIYFILCLLILFFTFRYLAGFYIIILIAVIGYNLSSNYILMKTLIECLSVGNNVDALESNIENKLKSMIDLDKKKLDNSYEKKLERMQKDLNRAELELTGLLDEFNKTFRFDDSNINSSRDNEINNKELTRSKLGKDINIQRGIINKIESNIRKLEDDLVECINNMENDYLKVGTHSDSLEIEPTIYYSFSPKPASFEFPFKSTVCIYEEERDYIDFINLLTVRISMSVNPECISFDLIDMKELGKNFLAFTGNDDYFSISSDEDSLKEKLSSLNDLLNKRMYTILTEADSIKEYNIYMKSIDSLTEDYCIIYIINPEPEFFNKPEIKRLIKNGASVGLYFFAFFSYDYYDKADKDDVKYLSLFEHLLFISEKEIKSVDYQKVLEGLCADYEG